MGKIISLRDHLESWHASYASDDGKLKISTSSHGRFKILMDDVSIVLDMVQSVRLLSQLSEDMSAVIKWSDAT